MSVAKQKKNLSREAKDALAKFVMERYEDACEFRQSPCLVQNGSAEEWIKRMYRAYHKIHEPTELKQFPQMRGYFGLIQLKVNATNGWIRNLTMSSEDSPVVLDPTPEPELPEHLDQQGKALFKRKILDKIIQQGAQVSDLIDPLTGALRKEFVPAIEQLAKTNKLAQRKIAYQLAKTALDNHSIVIKDQLIQGGWRQAYSQVMFDAILYPCGVMSTGEYGMAPVWTWKGNKISKVPKLTPKWRRISPDRAYFAPDASSARDGSYFIERRAMSRVDLINMRGDENALEDAIDECLNDFNADGAWLVEKDNDKDLSVLHNGDSGEVVAMQGYALGRDLKKWYSSISTDDNTVWNLNVMVCCNRTIYFDAQPDEMAGRNYVSVGYSDDGGSPYKISLGMQLWDRQKRLNRLDFFQAISEHKSHGPHIEVYGSAFIHPEDVKFDAWGVSESNPDGSGGKSGFTFHQAQPMWASLYDHFWNHLKLSDDECGIPAFAAYGTQGSAPTLGQDVIRFTAAQKGLQNFGLNIDQNVIEPAFDVLYHENMQYLKDKDIQADANIKARGITSLMQKELERMNLQQTLPIVLQLAQSQVIPIEMAKAAAREYLSGRGLPVDQYMPDPGGELQLEETISAQPALRANTVYGDVGGLAGTT